MSNNSAATSSLAIAQKTVKQLRLEASVRRIKVGLPSNLRCVIYLNQSCHRMCEHHQSIKSTNTHHCATLSNNLFRMYTIKRVTIICSSIC